MYACTRAPFANGGFCSSAFNVVDMLLASIADCDGSENTHETSGASSDTPQHCGDTFPELVNKPQRCVLSAYEAAASEAG